MRKFLLDVWTFGFSNQNTSDTKAADIVGGWENAKAAAAGVPKADLHGRASRSSFLRVFGLHKTRPKREPQRGQSEGERERDPLKGRNN